MNGAKHMAAGLFGAAAIVFAAGSFSGCVGWNTYPPMEGEHGFSNPNSDPLPQIMTEAVRWAAIKYPPRESAEWGDPVTEGSETFAVNLPKGVNKRIYNKIVENVGRGAVPMVPGNEALPTYHVARLWVRGDEAKVDIIRPVLGIPPAPDGRPASQGITLRLRGGLQPWRVTSHNVWGLNTVPEPALSYVPEQ